jgi:NAD+ kinase
MSTKSLHFWEEGQFNDDGIIDFVITLGGDGTVLYASWLFQQNAPPIIPFNLGSLGFLTVFDVTTCEKTIRNILSCESVIFFLIQGMRMNFRMRFKCIIHRLLNPDTNEREDDHGVSYQVSLL